MSWFGIALVNPFFSAIANHIDKVLIEKYLRAGEVGALVIFSALFSMVTLPVVLLLDTGVLSVGVINGVALALNDMLVVAALLLYLYALQKDEASYVVPLFQTIPLFGFLFGFLLLGETLLPLQIIGSCVIVLGALVLSFTMTSRSYFKRYVVLYMLSASLLFALNGVIYKYIALEEGFLTSLFWGFVGKIIAGVLLFMCVARYRKQFLRLMQSNSTPVLGGVILVEILFIFAESATGYALLLAPVTLVFLVSAFQPFFVFAIGSILTLMLPNLVKEKMDPFSLLQKGLGILLLLVGTVLIG